MSRAEPGHQKQRDDGSPAPPDLEQHGWARGFRAGKKRARIEVLVILTLLYFLVALIGRMAG